MPTRRLCMLLFSLVLGVSALPAQASAASQGPPVRGTLSGSGSSTIDSVGGHPVQRSISDGMLKATVLGPGTYHLAVSYTGTVRYASLTITTHGGTLRLSAGPFIDATLSNMPLTITEGTGRFARASGTLTLEGYAKTDVVCMPSPPSPVPNLFCNWNETAGLSAAIRLR